MVAAVPGGSSRPSLGLGFDAVAQATGKGSVGPRQIREALDVILGKGREPGLENSLSLDSTPRLRGTTDRVRLALLSRIVDNATKWINPEQPPGVKEIVQVARWGSADAAIETARKAGNWSDRLREANDVSGPRGPVDTFIRCNARWLR